MKSPLAKLLPIILILVSVALGDDANEHDAVERAAATTVRNAYRNVAADAMTRLPIGVFDSGTGGLTVLETILTMDEFDNGSHVYSTDGDGQRDFERESFIFLADQANMPYGNYPVVGKEELLDDLIVKDAWFLMGREYYRTAESNGRRVIHKKSPVKAVVIACNTATAYGQDDIQQVIDNAGLDIRVIGVIDAGAKGAVRIFQDGQPGTIAVVPTQGTVLSGAYPISIRQNVREMGLSQRIDVVQQGAFGLAGCIDGARGFVLLDSERSATREDYRGPSITNPDARIDRQILQRYDFDFSENSMLYSGAWNDPSELQLNSVANYISYHVVTLIEKIRATGDSPPLRAIVMGCTHFPFYEDVFRRELHRLRNYQEDGEFLYREFMAEKIEFVDPAVLTAQELYRSLATDNKLRTRAARNRGEFYVTIPRRDKPGLGLDDAGWFTYDHKYGRISGRVESDFRAVPLDGTNLEQSVFDRLQCKVPVVWDLMTEYRSFIDSAEHR